MNPAEYLTARHNIRLHSLRRITNYLHPREPHQ